MLREMSTNMVAQKFYTHCSSENCIHMTFRINKKVDKHFKTVNIYGMYVLLFLLERGIPIILNDGR